MTRRTLITLLCCATFLALHDTTPAQAGPLPCREGNLTATIRCLAHEIPHRGSLSYILGIGRCEGLLDRPVTEAYISGWQLTKDEARVFPRQAPREWYLLVKHLPLGNTYRATVGVLGHSRKYGWSWSACA